MKELHWPNLPENVWVRTCQECGLAQVTTAVDTRREGWRNIKCKKCKSVALDFGSVNTLQEDYE